MRKKIRTEGRKNEIPPGHLADTFVPYNSMKTMFFSSKTVSAHHVAPMGMLKKAMLLVIGRLYTGTQTFHYIFLVYVTYSVQVRSSCLYRPRLLLAFSTHSFCIVHKIFVHLPIYTNISCKYNRHVYPGGKRRQIVVTLRL